MARRRTLIPGESGAEENDWLWEDDGQEPTATLPSIKGPRVDEGFLPPVPSGYDPTKWNDPTYLSPKYQVGRHIAGGGSLEDAASLVGGTARGKDILNIPGLGEFDVIGDQEGARFPAWQPLGQGGGTGSAGGAGGGSPSSLTAPVPALRNYNWSADPFQGPDAEVGQDPFSLGVTESWMNLLGGQEDYWKGVNEQIQDLISKASAPVAAPTSPFGESLNTTIQGLLKDAFQPDPQQLALRMESAREVENRAFRALMSDARAALASRGLMEEPGTPSGPYAGAVGRISGQIAPEFAREAREAYLAEQGLSQERGLEALRQGVQSAQAQAANQLEATRLGQVPYLSALPVVAQTAQARQGSIMDTLRGMTERQQVLSNIALGTLDRNLSWNAFLAQYGLDKERIQEELRQGNIQALTPLIELYMRAAQQAAEGGIAEPPKD